MNNQISQTLNANRVEEIFKNCLFQESEVPPKEVVLSTGIIQMVGFHPNRLKKHSDEISSMLDELPDTFRKTGGDSFVNSTLNKNGKQWTDLHQRMEQLMQLGFSIGQIRLPFQRELWGTLPGGVPFFEILSERNEIRVEQYN